jgi:hypothetical protein
MPIGWFIVPYKRKLIADRPTRYCAMDDFTQQIIYQDGGNWSETEVLGNHAIVKVNAAVATLQAINAAAGFVRLPKGILDDSLSSLNAAQKTAIRGKIISLGYSLAELQARFVNDLGTYTLRDVLKFVTRRRLKPRYDAGTDTIICDGAIQPVRSLESVDEAVQ